MDQGQPPNEPQNSAGVSTAESGVVMLDGPDGVAVTMTAECADKTGRGLITAAEEALTQRANTPKPD
jgi:hypothetical protein